MTAAQNQARKPTGGATSRTRVRRGAGTIGMYALLIGVAVIFLFPFIFMLTTAFKTSEEVFRYPPQLLPMQAATATLRG